MAGVPPRRNRASAGVAAVLLLGAATAVPLRAQVSVRLGGLAVEYDGVPRLAGLQLSPAIRSIGGALYSEFGGNGARFDDGSWSIDASGLAAWRPQRVAGLDPEFIATAGITTAKGADPTNALGGQLRLHRSAGLFDLFVGGGLGRAEGALGVRGQASAEVGVTWSGRTIAATASIAPNWVDGVRHTDAGLYLRHGSRLILETSIGVRRTAVADDEVWASAGAEFPLTPRLHLVAAAGSFPVDPVQGYSRGRFLSVGVRLGSEVRTNLRSPGGVAERPLPWPGATFRVRDRGDGRRELIITAPQATTVEVAGDFSDWSPLPMTQERGRWVLRVTLPAGVHRVNFRVDGGAWQVPPGLERVTDEFGGAVGILPLN